MAIVEDVRDILQNLRLDGIEYLENGDISIALGQRNHALTKAEVEDYLSIRSTIALEPETAIYAPGYYEQLVNIQGSMPLSLQWRDPDRRPIELTSADGQMTIKLTSLSTRFLLAVFDKSEPGASYLNRRARIAPYRRYSDRPDEQVTIPQLRDVFARFWTIQVAVNDSLRPRVKRSTLQAIAEAALFNISFALGIGVGLSTSWERTIYRLGKRRTLDIQFPRKAYKSDLVAYYQLALGSDSSILAYLSLYKILEYFCVSTAEVTLHKRLKDKLAAPDFSLKQAASLRDIASLVRKFDQRTDEQKMLAGVLEHYFMPDEIGSWLSAYEKHEGSYYTSPQTILGVSCCVDLNTDQVYSSLARRIYHMRNALVHNKEGDLPRFVPFSEHDEIIIKELPLLMFLTEQLIIKTGQDI